MKSAFCKHWLLAVVCGCSCLGFFAEVAHAEDLRDAAPPSAYMTIYGMHNPEREYQEVLYQAVWKEVENTKIAEKVLQILESKIGDSDAQKFVEVRDAFRAALEPIEWDKLTKTSEVLYAQRIEGPTSVHVLLARIPDGGAESLKTAVVNLFDMATAASNGQLPVVTETIAGVELQSLQLPEEAAKMMQPSIGVKGNVLVFTTSLSFVQEALELLENPSGDSKFDDPRVTDALSHLPKAEDSMFIFDGKRLAEQLKSIPDFITRISNGNPEAQRAADLISELVNQADAFDIDVTVEYTDGFKNRSASFGRISKSAGSTVLGQMLTKQQPFENWTQLVPSSATGFSMSSGLNLLPLYNWLMEEIPARFPESQGGLNHIAAVQDQFDVHLKEDLLEAFSGEIVSVSSPGAPTAFGKGSQSVTMIRCSKPDRIQELIHRGMNALTEIPQVKAQGISLSEVPGLDGFEELKAQALAVTGLRPVIGFRDGWMVIGTHASAVESLFATKAGEGTSWSDSDRFKEFGLTIDGSVASISYTNTGENIRNIAQGLQQAGMLAPMLIGMAQSQNQGQGGPDLQVVQDVMGLLPSIGRIVSKLDFIDATMSVSQPGSESGTYTRQSVTLIRPPKEVKPASPSSPTETKSGAKSGTKSELKKGAKGK